MSELSLLRAEVSTGLRDFSDASVGDRESLSTMATILRFNNLKIAASEQAPRAAGAMNVCGIVGYKNDTPFSVGRHSETRCPLVSWSQTIGSTRRMQACC
jgi:acyl-CoA dehydrogenase